jgi:triosephosphate isomerase (TIM)
LDQGNQRKSATAVHPATPQHFQKPSKPMRKTLIAGNWKMHTTLASAHALALGLAETPRKDHVEVLILPPFPYLSMCQSAIDGSPVKLGAQNMAAQLPGAFTGEVSAEMLKDVGCDYVLVGHSERRHIFGESDALVAEKFIRAQSVGLTPILCVGETLPEREAGQTFSTVARQLDAVLAKTGALAFENAVLAYEPLWAIGTGKTATPEQAQEVHSYLRSQIAAHNAKVAGLLKILYGGSVKGANAGTLLAMPDVDGALVGGAALQLAEFQAIISAA